MKPLLLKLKKLIVPASNETKEVDAVQLWEVRWWSRCGQFMMGDPSYTSARKEVECFTSEEQALEFKQALEAAFRLLRYSGSGIDVTMKKASS